MKLRVITGRDATGRGLTDHLARLLPAAEILVHEDSEPMDVAGGMDESALYVAASRGGRHGVLPDLLDAEAVFEALPESLEHLVVLSSAAVHEPSAHHLQLLDEESEAPRRTGNPLPDAWSALEELAGELPIAVTVLRPSPLLVPGGRDYWSRQVRRPVAFPAPGYDPTLQCLALEDLACAVAAVLRQPPPAGRHRVYHVAPRGVVPLRAMLRRARTLRLPVPLTVQRPLRATLSPTGASAPPRQLDWTRHPSTVSAERIERELGFRPRLSSLEAIDRCRQVVAETTRAADDADTSPEPPFDPFGLDRDYHRRLSKTLFRFLQRAWWRVDYRGLENVPAEGGAVLAGVHRGFQPWDGVMAMDQIARTRGRYLRFLVHPSLIKPPFLAPYMSKLGGVPACRENAEWVLERGQLLGIFPEGIRGAFRRYGPQIYELGKFGRDEFVRFAIRAGVPIVPFVTVGSAEIFPILARLEWSWWRRVVEWPYFPITPTMGTIPLPSKWHTRFLEPLPTDHLGPEAADDRARVSELSQQVRARMRGALDDMLARRRHIFWGSLDEPERELDEPELEGHAP